jgi:hypothetical protein
MVYLINILTKIDYQCTIKQQHFFMEQERYLFDSIRSTNLKADSIGSSLL